MEKSIIALALIAASGAAQAIAFEITGIFEMRDPTGMLMQHDTSLMSTLFLDANTGSGSFDDITTEMAFFGSIWTAHDISLQLTGPTTATLNLLWDWGLTSNTPMHFDMTYVLTPSGGINILTSDGNGDGIAGLPMDSGPFPGFSTALHFEGYPDGDFMPEVPLPASAWLFGSGLIGLFGIAKRKART